MEKRLLTVEELGTYLSLPKSSIYTMVCNRKIPRECVVKIGRVLRFEREAIDKWISGKRSCPGS
ncbi:MAG TPA: DNA-binding protein [Elusimicrobia bacterium]|nr:DNA-binding protein [Elusimicrobiota bacterium]